MSAVLVADVGRTTCRVARFAGAHREAEARAHSGASLADADGAARIAAAVRRAVTALPAGEAATAVVVGTTGLAQAPAAGRALADALLVDHPDAEVVLATDVLTAHLGALAGDPGVCLVAGTGAVALAVPAHGRSRIVDGHGYLLGDDGSGFAVGRAGLRAALRHHEGRSGGSAALARAARVHVGDLGRLAGAVQSDPDAVRRVAGFAVAVADAARAGDTTARAIWADAVAALADTAAAACRHVAVDPVPVGLAGSLFDLDDLVTAPLAAAITTACPGARPERARGDALDGARLLAGHHPGIDTDRLQADGLLLRFARGETPARHRRRAEREHTS
ncbi:BadF/BadG/BcrA/BcrD ATPase family protein [Egicoccus sp. AB-alg2]|uniref:BadF/BadG/BcrA/BcrD ATPase family protein n=1 Tax=Egicoccus sp. AB-alg2 TaxID=3242693 RepID=UPI00359E33B6